MSIRAKLYVRWIRFLKKLHLRINNILVEHDEGFIRHQTLISAYPVTVNEWYDFDSTYRDYHTKKYYKDRLKRLKEDVHETIKLNNCRLTYEQILELEEIKSNLNKLK